MSDQNTYIQPVQQHGPVLPQKRSVKSSVWINVLLFILTFYSTTIAGVAWLNKDPFNTGNFHYGLPYSVLLLIILSCHEFGHYFAAKYHDVQVTLPYYIPFPFIMLNPFGTMGAVIRMRSPARTRKALFDIGIAGPVAGFVASFAILVYGFTHLPPVEYIYSIHPEYETTGIATSGFSFGPTLLYAALAKIFTASPKVFLPPMNEIYHYPFLCAGWFGLFITALNLLPVGQLDGGHITYALLRDKHRLVARAFFVFLLFMGLLGLLPFAGFYEFANYGLFNWLVWAILIFFIIRIEHPPLFDNEPVGTNRKIWGVFALFMFVTSFTPVPFANF